MPHDLRYAVRSLAKNRGLSAVIVLTLTVGIGATTAIFSLVYGLLLKPLPFRDAERLVWVSETTPRSGRMSVSWPNSQDWRDRARSFDGIAAQRQASFNVTGTERAERLDARVASGNFFALLGTTPELGRLIGPEDDRTGAAPVAMISHRYWQRRFGGDPATVGKSLTLDGRSVAIVGVLPPGFQLNRADDLFVPLVPFLTEIDADRGNHVGLNALARLAPGVSQEQAEREMQALATALAQEYPASNSGNGAEVHPLRTILVEHVETALLVLMAGVASVLLIGCVNVANLLLARGASRQGEMALRLALGAGRGRIARQLLVESLLLSGLGGLLGLGFAYQALPLLMGWLRGVPRLETVTMDGRVLVFTAAVALATGLVFGTLPVFQAGRRSLARSVRQPGGGLAGKSGAHGLMGRGLLVAEVTLALVLLTAAGLMVRTLLHLGRVDAGIETERLLALSFDLTGPRYDTAGLRLAHREIEERVRAVAGVEAAGLALSLPFDGSNWGSVFVVGDQPVPPRAELPSAAFNPVSPGLLPALGARLLAGRLLTGADNGDAPAVVVINEALARRFWPGESPLGKRIKHGWPEDPTRWREVVGVVADIKLEGVAAATPMQVYLPLEQLPVGNLFLVVRTAQEPAAAARAVEEAVRGFDRDVPVFAVRALTQVYADSIANRRLPTLFLGQFSLAALVLAALGIFGLMAYSVARRTQEMGLRLALGASRREVVRQVVSEGMKPVAAGVALGLIGSLLVTRYLRSLLFEVQPTDPVSFGVAVLLLAAVALAAAYLPARRAARVDPMVALRAE